jgi:hypothetical protein
VLYLDLAPAAALERLHQRGRFLEVHESLENLTRLDQLARAKLGELARIGVACATLPVAALDERGLVEAVLAHFEPSSA